MALFLQCVQIRKQIIALGRFVHESAKTYSESADRNVLMCGIFKNSMH